MYAVCPYRGGLSVQVATNTSSTVYDYTVNLSSLCNVYIQSDLPDVHLLNKATVYCTLQVCYSCTK